MISWNDVLGPSYCIIAAPKALHSSKQLCRVLALISSLTRIELAVKQEPLGSVRFESDNLVMDLMTTEAAEVRRT